MEVCKLTPDVLSAEPSEPHTLQDALDELLCAGTTGGPATSPLRVDLDDSLDTWFAFDEWASPSPSDFSGWSEQPSTASEYSDLPTPLLTPAPQLSPPPQTTVALPELSDADDGTDELTELASLFSDPEPAPKVFVPLAAENDSDADEEDDDDYFQHELEVASEPDEREGDEALPEPLCPEEGNITNSSGIERDDNKWDAANGNVIDQDVEEGASDEEESNSDEIPRDVPASPLLDAQKLSEVLQQRKRSASATIELPHARKPQTRKRKREEEEEDDDEDYKPGSSSRTRHAAKRMKAWACKFKGCSNTFTRMSDLKRHLQSHLGIREKCLICGNVYSRLDAVRRHSQTSHPGQRVRTEAVMPEDEDDFPPSEHLTESDEC